MKIVDIFKNKISEIEFDEIIWEHTCPKCHSQLKVNWHNFDSGNWECLNCDIEYQGDFLGFIDEAEEAE
jgi:ribosomal protein L37AE/L43A